LTEKKLVVASLNKIEKMKNLMLLATGSTLLLMLVFTSCKKKGCTDELAINYFEAVKKDDGSCSYSSTRLEGRFSYLRNNDTVSDTAQVYSFERSHMKVEGGTFDFLKTDFSFLIDWSTKSMAMPDSIVPFLIIPLAPNSPYYGKVEGKIVSRDNFTITYTQEIPTWNNVTITKDTVITYDFKRV
jgi:hypothetical protein